MSSNLNNNEGEGLVHEEGSGSVSRRRLLSAFLPFLREPSETEGLELGHNPETAEVLAEERGNEVVQLNEDEGEVLTKKNWLLNRVSNMSRRRLCVLAGLMAAEVYILCNRKKVNSFIRDYIRVPLSDLMAPEANRKNVERLSRHLESRYDCEVDFFESGRFSILEKEKILIRLTKALSKYPPEMIKKLKLSFHHERSLKRHTKTPNVLGVAHGPHYKGGDGSYRRNDRNHIAVLNLTDEETIHHEVFHILDKYYYAQEIEDCQKKNCENIKVNVMKCYIETCNWQITSKKEKIDEIWVQMHNKLEGGYFEDQHVDLLAFLEGMMRDSFGDSSRVMRFYGLLNEDEDRATYAERMMTYPQQIQQIIKGSCSDQPCIRAQKIALIKKYFFNWSKGKMDEQYWKDAAAGVMCRNIGITHS